MVGRRTPCRAHPAASAGGSRSRRSCGTPVGGLRLSPRPLRTPSRESGGRGSPVPGGPGWSSSWSAPVWDNRAPRTSMGPTPAGARDGASPRNRPLRPATPLRCGESRRSRSPDGGDAPVGGAVPLYREGGAAIFAGSRAPAGPLPLLPPGAPLRPSVWRVGMQAGGGGRPEATPGAAPLMSIVRAQAGTVLAVAPPWNVEGVILRRV